MNLDILVIDDDDILRNELSEWLIKEGHNAKSVGTGEAAVNLVKNQNFNLVFTDLKMPGMNGIEVLKGVKKLRPEAHMVMISGYGNIDTAVEAMKAGADDYIRKPFETDQIQSVIKSITNTIEFETRVKKLDKPQIRKPKDPFEFFKSLIHDDQALCITQQNPKDIIDMYDLDNISMIWVTPDEVCDSCIHPRNIYDLKLHIEFFCKDHPDGVILMDCMEALLSQHSWDVVKKFISDVSSKLLDKSSQFIISVGPDQVEEDALPELERLVSNPYIQLISDSLSSPMRREIVRFLSYYKSSSFTGILKSLNSSEPPKLSFHLKKLVNDRILQKNDQKVYSLTDRGNSTAEFLSTLEKEAACNLQNNVSLIFNS